MIVTPEWPPTTGIRTDGASRPVATSAAKVEARTTSRVETPKSLDSAKVRSMTATHLFGSKTPAFLRTSATIGTVELTGLEITSTKAFGQAEAIPVAKSRTMPALILKRSSRVIPGYELAIHLLLRGQFTLRGTPAGMTTMSAPVRACLRPSSFGRNPVVFDAELMWLKSAATPGVLTIS